MKLGFYDSGIGGLNVLNEAADLIPEVDFIYYADTVNAPYGLKTVEQVLRYAIDAVEFLAHKGIDGLVVACNTATSAAVRYLRSVYDFPIIGMEPAVKPAMVIAKETGKRVIVTATDLTIKGDKLKQLIERVGGAGIVDTLPLSHLVDFAEALLFDGPEPERYLKEQLRPFCLQDYCALVLGCTHFNYYVPCFKKLLPDSIALIDGNRGTIKYTIKLFLECGIPVSGNSMIRIYDSGRELTGDLRIRYESLISRLPNLNRRDWQ